MTTVMRDALLCVAVSCLVLAPTRDALAQSTGSGTANSSDVTEQVTTTELMTQAYDSFMSCGMWHVSGICFFLVCDGPECHIETSERYSHMRPDLVVSTYHDLDNHPWTQVGAMHARFAMRQAKAIYGSLIEDSAGTRSRKQRVVKNVRYRDGDAIGHPSTDQNFGGDSEQMCPGVAESNKVYFSSFTDVLAWRNYLPADMLYLPSWVPGLREIGVTTFNTWGNVFPRTGWVTQQHVVKAAAVLSQRIADVVTNNQQPHQYNYLPSGEIRQMQGKTVFLPQPALEASLLGGQWQFSAPRQGAMATSCHVFGMQDTLGSAAYGDGLTTKTESYAYTLWRPYACCKTKGAFIYSIIWGMW